jgi:hypothetical protein
VETVKKPSVVGEAFSDRCGNPAFVADFHQRRQFPQASSFSLFTAAFFFLVPPTVFQRKS